MKKNNKYDKFLDNVFDKLDILSESGYKQMKDSHFTEYQKEIIIKTFINKKIEEGIDIALKDLMEEGIIDSKEEIFLEIEELKVSIIKHYLKAEGSSVS